ncbi:hypothetical protein GF361_00115 [Candidatus Woesearchaeota archaeon]|nr:hypothetical protein [Candidatus Woesearchaeota archaeon]
MFKKIKNAILGATLALGLYAGTVKAEEPKFNLGYNALETAVDTERTSEGERTIRNRLFTNVSLDIKELEIGYQGLNEVNDWDSDSYFGRNRFMFGKVDSPLKLLIDTKANKKEIFDTKVGARYSGLMQKLGGYGNIDMSLDDEALNLNLFYGKPLGKGFSVEFSQDITKPYGEDASYYTELQLNKSLTDRISLFGRLEMAEFDNDKKKYLVGLSIK